MGGLKTASFQHHWFDVSRHLTQPCFSFIAMDCRGYGKLPINTPALDNLQVLHGQLGKLLIVR